MKKINIKKTVISTAIALFISALIHIFVLSAFIIENSRTLPELCGLLISIVSIFVYPLAPIFYGLKAHDRSGSVIVGTVPTLCLFYELHLSSFIAGNIPETDRIIDIVTYFGSLTLIGGLEG